MPIDDFLMPRESLLPPLPEHAMAADLLSSAADAILSGDLGRAGDLVRQADMPVLFAFARRLMGREDHDIHRRRPMPHNGVKSEKVLERMPGSAGARASFERDGWRCRFCGCQVVSANARKAMRASLPGAIPWSKAEGFHGGLFALTSSVDHVVPHSAGGGNDLANLVTACWSCQFGRGSWTVGELGLADPRDRAPVVDGWDGLSRLLTRVVPAASVRANIDGCAPEKPAMSKPTVAPGSGAAGRVFTPDQARWLASLDEDQLPLFHRILGFLDGCADLNVSWSLKKVLLARMRIGPGVVEFMGVCPTGEVHLPWSLGGHKAEFRGFADILSEGIPGAVCYETPKQWNISRPEKKRLGLAKLSNSLPAFRMALEALHSALLDSAQA